MRVYSFKDMSSLVKKGKAFALWCLLVLLLLGSAGFASADGQIGMERAGSQSQYLNKIVVLPVLSENGQLMKDISAKDHYARVAGYFNNALVAIGMEVVSPKAYELLGDDTNDYLQRSITASSLVAKSLTARYAADAACIVAFELSQVTLNSGKVRVTGRLGVNCYDGLGNDLGVRIDLDAVSDSEQAERARVVVEIEKRLGTEVGKEISFKIKQNMLARQQFLYINLEGADQYEVIEAFGKIIDIQPEVIRKKRGAGKIVPAVPQKSSQEWRLTLLEETDSSQLQDAILASVKDVLAHCGEEGYTLNGMNRVIFNYSCSDLLLFKGIFPGLVNSQKIHFGIDRGRVREK